MINIDKNLFLQQPLNTIAITSGVGSMGKTWLAATLAQALNLQQQSVLLFDANGGLLNLDFQLGGDERPYLNDVISGKITFNQAVISLGRRKLDMITAVSGSDILEDLSPGRLQILRDDLKIVAQDYDNVLIDLPASEKIIKHLLPTTAALVLVCTSDPSNLVSTYNFLQRADFQQSADRMQIVVNYAQSYEEGLRTYNTLRHACERYIKITPPLLGVIRRDTRVRDVIRNRMPLLSRYPNSEAAEDVMQIARKLMEEKSHAATNV